MKLADHVEHIRKLIDSSFQNRLGRMGVSATALQPIDAISSEFLTERKRIETIREVWIEETGTVAEAYEKLVEEFTFTLFNRLAALKVMEAHTLQPEIITRRSQHGDRSFAHKHWLEQTPDGRNEEMEGLVHFMEDQLAALSADILLFSPQHPYHLLPTAIELNGIMSAFNQVEIDAQVEPDIWKSDDVLGWLYEAYQATEKKRLKEEGIKIEYDKVRIQSCVYTPRWVVKFLVDNSLGKLYLEMYPDSDIKNHYKIANAPKIAIRAPKPLTEIKLIDTATGSGNFLLYGFDLFYDLYTDQIENYGADYDEREIAELIITHNLHGIDLDDRAVQLAQLGLYIKAKRKIRSAKIDQFNIVSSDFFLPPYSEVKHLFESGQPLSPELEEIVTDLWADLQQAFKFGALIRLEEKFSMKLHRLVDQFERAQKQLFEEQTLANYDIFRHNFFNNLQEAVTQNTAKQGQTFLNIKTQDAITFLQVLTQKYDVVVANPPYTDSADFGPELKVFVDANYKQPDKFNINLYASFIKRCCELVDEKGKVALVHPPTFMYIKSFEDVRKYMIEKMHISLFVEWGYLGMFNPTARVDAAMYILEKDNIHIPTKFIKLSDIYEGKRYEILIQAYDDLLADRPNKHNISLLQEKLKIIKSWPFIYWISDEFREKFKYQTVSDIGSAKPGLQTGSNERFVRFWWELDKNTLSQKLGDNKKWKGYAKGGDYNKWAGNLWLKLNWLNNGAELRNCEKAILRNEEFYFKSGITYSASGSRGGTSFRILPENHLFDVGGASIFIDKDKSSLYALALFNSKISNYLLDCLNPTANFQKGDIDRLLFFEEISVRDQVIQLSNFNVNLKSKTLEFLLKEESFKQSPIFYSNDKVLTKRLIDFLSFENLLNALILIAESIIDKLIISSFNLPEIDIKNVIDRQGRSLGSLPVSSDARDEFLSAINGIDVPNSILEYIRLLEIVNFSDVEKNKIIFEFNSLYKDNNALEGFCNQARKQNPLFENINPINVWYWFKESRVLPQARAAEIALEFLADAFRTILMEDEDGIVPLVGLPGEPRLMDRLEQYCFQQGLTSAQFMQLDGLIGRPINEYIEHHFFKNFSDHLNLFMYLPKTPFIWHLSSGEHQGFESYIIIYKWNRDSLYKLKSSYLSKSTESLQYRLQQIGDSTSAQAQTEKETIRLQLQEIDAFAKKIDELIANGYDPKLDDGVGKNIAPLQSKDLLRTEVLKSTGRNSQLQKYLNAEW